MSKRQRQITSYTCINCNNVYKITIGALEVKKTKFCNSCALISRRTLKFVNPRMYGIWSGMKTRCNNSNATGYKIYGGRGITYCKEWEKFENFYNDMKDGYNDSLTIDRINHNKEYCKDNCRWVSMVVQNNNKRSNRLLTYKGDTMTLRQLSEKYNFPYEFIRGRLKCGWKLEEAISSPKRINQFE